MRRSFRTLRLCAIPGVSPRAGMRRPVGALRTPHLPRAFLRLHEAAAGTGRSEHWNVHILSPVARPRESPTGPNGPCERRTDPAEPHRGTDPQRQPRHSATAKQVRAPEGMRRSFRTLRLCGIPGVSPRAGMRCPVGALRTPHLPRGFLSLHEAAAGPGPQSPTEDFAKETDGRPECVSVLGSPFSKPVQLSKSTGTNPFPRRVTNPCLKRLPAAAGRGRSEHRKRTTKPLARSANGSSFPELPCERRAWPAEPHRQRAPEQCASEENPGTACGGIPSPWFS